MKQVYLSRDGKMHGPFTIGHLRQLIESGEFSEDDHACHDGKNWVKAREVPGIAKQAKVRIHGRPTLKMKSAQVQVKSRPMAGSDFVHDTSLRPWKHGGKHMLIGLLGVAVSGGLFAIGIKFKTIFILFFCWFLFGALQFLIRLARYTIARIKAEKTKRDLPQTPNEDTDPVDDASST